MQQFNEFLKSYLAMQEFKTISIENGVNLFLNDMSKTRRAETISYYKDHLKPFLLFCNIKRILYFNDLTDTYILDYIRYLQFKKNENYTINKRLALIKLVIKYLVLNEYNSNIKLIIPKLEEKPKEIKCINDSALKRLIEYAFTLETKQKLIILLLITTGIRRNELVNITLDNIDYVNLRIYLDYTKTHKPRYIFLDSSLVPMIHELIKNNLQKKYLFENSLGFQMEAEYITQLLFFIKRKLDIPFLSPHKLRHTYATYLLKNGANQEQVRRLLGHTDFKMTQRYIDYIEEDLQQANSLYNPLNLVSR